MARMIRMLMGSILLATCLTSCAAPVLPPLADGVVRVQQVREGLTFTLDSQSAPRKNTTQHLRITLVDADGRPVENANIYFDMTMNMLCLSDGKPVANAVGRGGYEVDVVYVMAGDWKVTAVATLGDRDLRATFPIHVTE
ncbi:MAG: FixH family protein [Chloroflexales bacterium]